MKRAIKLWNKYGSDAFRFSNCSTDYEVLPFLVDDETDGDIALQSIASFLDLKVSRTFEVIEAKQGY